MWVLIPIITHHILPGSIIISDEWRAYSCLYYFADYHHETVNHISDGQMARSDDLENVPVVSEIYSESDSSDDPYGAGSGESASEYSDD